MLTPSGRFTKKFVPFAILALAWSVTEGNGSRAGGETDDDEVRIAYGYSPLMQLGFLALDKKNDWQPLTFSFSGTTNSTVLRIKGEKEEGEDVVFGRGGEWRRRVIIFEPRPCRDRCRGLRSIWVYKGVLITQEIEVVRSVKGDFDACLVRYRIKNESEVEKELGLRVLLDTFIVDKDAPSFALPKSEKLIKTHADYPSDGEIPQYVRAFQHDDPKNMGLVAYLTLQLGGGLESPNRFSITTLPPERDRQKWDVKVENMRDDAAVVLRWNPKKLAPGQEREFGYGYGLGIVALHDDGKIKAAPGGK
jgi:hypothetical protein